jgi:hypothetical protein
MVKRILDIAPPSGTEEKPSSHRRRTNSKIEEESSRVQQNKFG